jgi:hypothetical protein
MNKNAEHNPATSIAALVSKLSGGPFTHDHIPENRLAKRFLENRDGSSKLHT